MNDQSRYVREIKFCKGGYFKIIKDDETEQNVHYNKIVEITILHNEKYTDVRIVTAKVICTFGVEHLDPIKGMNIGDYIKMRWETFQREEAKKAVKAGDDVEEINENL